MHITVYGGSLIAKSLLLGLLQNNSHEITWICPAYVPIKRWIALSNSSINLFKKLNVWENLDNNLLQKVTNINIGDKDNTPLNLNAYKNYLNQLAYITCTHNIDEALTTALNFTPRLNKINANIQNIIHDDYNNKCKITLSSSQTINTDILALSQNYQNSNIELDYTNNIEYSYKHKAITAVLQADIAHNGHAYQWFIEKDILALLPLPNNQFALIWSTHQAENRIINLLDSLHSFQPLIKNLKITACIDEPQLANLQLRINPNLKQKNIVLLGDMAHRIHPLAGQGLNLGLRDVDLLLQYLYKCNKTHLQNQLEQYVGRRNIDIYMIASITHNLYKFNNFALSSLLLPATLKIIDKLPFMKKLMLKIAN